MGYNYSTTPFFLFIILQDLINYLSQSCSKKYIFFFLIIILIIYNYNMNKRILLNLILSIIIALPVGFFIAMISTPLFWKLEGILHIELAGHSGPADWVIITTIIITALLLFIIMNKLLRK